MCIIIEAPEEGIFTCRSKVPNGAANERQHDYVIVCRLLLVKVKKINVVEDFEPRPHKAVTFQVEKAWEVRELNMPKALSSFSGEKTQGRRKAEGGNKDGRRFGCDEKGSG